MKKPEIVPATSEIVHDYYEGKQIPSMRAFAVKDEDKVIALFGLCYRKDVLVLFSDIKPEARKFRKTIVACGRKVMGLAKTLGVPVYAAADDSIAGSGRFLESMGFIRNANGVYTWQNYL